jgi:DNA modification methylase
VTPYYDDGRAVLYVGHVLDVLAGLEAGTVQTCITSPPYWGLRAYGTDPQVWGGEPSCSHSLEETAPGKVLTGGTGTASAKQVSNNGSQYGNAWAVESRPGQTGGDGSRSGLNCKRDAENRFAPDSHAHGSDKLFSAVTSATCTRCGAWRGELGSEPTPEQYVEHIVEVFREVRRVLRKDGVLFLNLGDSYAGSGKGPTGKNGIGNQGKRQGFTDPGATIPSGMKPKDLVGIPWMVALALRADGWYLRQDCIWAKPNPMPESVTDRCTRSHEYLFVLSKSAKYYWDGDAIKEPAVMKPQQRLTPRSEHPKGDEGRPLHRQPEGATDPGTRNKRSVWTIPTEAYPAAHFATFPRTLVEPCVLAGTSARGQCSACGLPWARTSERAYAATPKACKGPTRTGKLATEVEQQDRGVNWARDGHVKGLVRADTTTGWAPSCTCDAGEPVPQICLDPFAGSGTTLAVARWHQRRAVGIELNPEYARLIEQRLAQGVLL